jgi:hypothetical protein
VPFAIDALHDAYLAAVDANPGKLPLVALDDIREVDNPSGTSFEPVFEIIDWVPRPTELPADGIAAQKKKKSPPDPIPF